MECEIGFALDECGCLPAVLPTVNTAGIYIYFFMKYIPVGWTEIYGIKMTSDHDTDVGV